MKSAGYYIALPLIYILVLIPFPLLYGVSDLTFFVLYHIVGYRKKVVMQNLSNAFPGKNRKELKIIASQFYSHLCDLFLETFKTLVISRSSALKHCTLDPDALALFEKYHKEKKSIIIVLGHFGNWELAGNTFSLLCKHQLYVIYHPLADKNFNGLMYKIRTRFGSKLISMKDTYKDMVRFKDEINATAFIADQTPLPDNAYWTTFLNQDTPVFQGTEKIARKMNYPVIYVSVNKKKRGYYSITATTLFEEPKNTKEGEISERHTRQLESDILKQPETWLWSHRRWKHKRPQPQVV